jgi:hypothetical protein
MKYIGIELFRRRGGGDPEPRLAILFSDSLKAQEWLNDLRPGRWVVIRRVYALETDNFDEGVEKIIKFVCERERK